jgi:hypothetical protein
MTSHEPDRDHLTSEALAAYLGGDADHDAVAAADTHFAECRACRDELVALRSILADQPREEKRRPARWWMPTAALAVAAALLVVVTLRVPRGTDSSARERAVAGDGGGVATVSPTDGAVVDPARVTLAWRTAAPGATYRVTITDSVGTPVWSAATDDTVAQLPADRPLARGRRYRWYVDALLPDARTFGGGARAFVTTP